MSRRRWRASLGPFQHSARASDRRFDTFEEAYQNLRIRYSDDVAHEAALLTIERSKRDIGYLVRIAKILRNMNYDDTKISYSRKTSWYRECNIRYDEYFDEMRNTEDASADPERQLIAREYVLSVPIFIVEEYLSRGYTRVHGCGHEPQHLYAITVRGQRTARCRECEKKTFAKRKAVHGY